MPLTPADIEQKTFATAFKGYDLAEVDDFLDEVVATIRELEEQLALAKSAPPVAAVAALDEPRLDEPRVEPTAPPVAPDEGAVGRVLILAQSTADRLVEDARSEADRIKAEAMSEAEQIKSNAVAEAESWQTEKVAKEEEARQAIATLEERVSSVRRELSALAGSLDSSVSEMERVVSEGSLDTAATPESPLLEAAAPEPVAPIAGFGEGTTETNGSAEDYFDIGEGTDDPYETSPSESEGRNLYGGSPAESADSAESDDFDYDSADSADASDSADSDDYEDDSGYSDDSVDSDQSADSEDDSDDDSDDDGIEDWQLEGPGRG